ncbi:MAG: transposase [Flavobacteriaceae bacterium]|nr:transposase [Flavobacteriaceae bacterium]
MDSNAKIANKIKLQISKFSGIISKEFSKPKRRLIKEIVFGIQASKDVKLSNIARSLKEEIPLIKTEDRLSRNLSDIDFTESVNNTISRLASNKILKDTVIALDPGEIVKPYAKKMENLCKVRDGSKKEIAKGYWLCQVVGSNITDNDAIPLYNTAYSQEADDFKSANAEIIKAIDTVSVHIGDRGIWTIDRGGDNVLFFKKFIKEDKKFVIRIKQNRNIVYKNKTLNIKKFANDFICKHDAKITYFKEGKEKVKNISYGSATVKIDAIKDQEINLVIIKGFGQIPMLLFTNKMVNNIIPESVWKIVEIYLTRWKCEEVFRYTKQSYNLEDVRVRSYIGVRNIVVLVLAIAYFTSVYVGKNLKLKMIFEKIFFISKRFFGIPAFYNYAMADGIYNYLFNNKYGIEYITKKLPKMPNNQLELLFE